MNANGPTQRLLVLDDEADVAATICRMAESAAYKTKHTDNSETFFDYVRSWSPSHVAVDLQLSNRDGIEVIHQLAAMRCKAAVIIVSGLGGRILDSAARAAIENGLNVSGTLSKPFTRNELLPLLIDADHDAGAKHAGTSSGQRINATADDIDEALLNKSFTTHFQPKVSCINGQVLGFECLARWHQQDGGFVMPDVFIGIAERDGQIHALTRQIYEHAFANIPWGVRESRLKLALNISPINLNDETFPHWLLEKCGEYGISPSSIILELTETANTDNSLALLESLTQFRIRGFHLSIDDFGVGYSSLVQLARLPFSELKIDHMFVKTIASSDESRKIVTAVIGLGKALGLNVAAEGVEDEQALEFLRIAGCDEAQGYFIAKPMGTVTASRWAQARYRTES